MKKLVAMLAALCVMCGVAGGGAENIFTGEFLSTLESLERVTGTQTVGGFTFDIPEGWTADFRATDYMLGALPGTSDADVEQMITLSYEADPAIRMDVEIRPVTSQNDKKMMDTYNQGGLGMLSPAEIAVYTKQNMYGSGMWWGPQIEFVTIGTFAGEPVRRTYSGFIGEYIDAAGNVQKARVSAVAWSSEEIGKEIVVELNAPQYAEDFDRVVDEFMKSFRYGDEYGTYDEDAAALARMNVNADDFTNADIVPTRLELFDLSRDDFDFGSLAGADMDDAWMYAPAGSVDMSDIDLGEYGLDLSKYGIDDSDLGNYDFGSFDFGNINWSLY